MIKNFKWLLLVALTFVACNDNVEEVVVYNTSDGLAPTAGSANFSKYVALGDSYAAGFSDGALFIEGQKGAYPNILAKQFALVGGGVFTTPFMKDEIGGFSSGGVQIPQFGPRLYLNGLTPTPVPGISGTSITDKLTGSYNNMGIPGAKVIHLDFSGYGSAAGNPFFARFASNPTTTVLKDALAQTPTFFSLWIGGNDVLGYALTGGDGTNQITPTATFNGAYNGIVTQMAAGGRKGVIGNIPYIDALPHFRTVPYNPVPLDAATITLLMNTTTGYGKYNGGLLFAQSNGLLSAAEVARRTIAFAPGSGNKVVIEDNYLTNLTAYGIPSIRQTTPEDLIVLPASSFIGTTVGGDPTKVNGVSVPLADKWVLSKDEVLETRVAIDAYNPIIQAAAEANNLAFVDLKSLMIQLSTTGITANSFTLNSAYVSGGTFSLDGFHPSPRGYALFANKFIEAINIKYGSNLNGVNLGNYRILFPKDPANY